MGLPEKVKLVLIGKSAGICEFRGCRKNLLNENLTKKIGNYSNFAHIIAQKANGPRGDKVLSPKLKNKESNIMVLCYQHHKLIDENEKEYPVKMLEDMKKEHEEFVKNVMKMKIEDKVTVVRYIANIGDRRPEIDEADIDRSLLKQKKYYNGNIIDLNGCKYDENLSNTWFEVEKNNLIEVFNQNIKPQLKKGENNAFFLYAIAPQPLLIFLGTLFSEITNVEVQQLQREPIKEWYLEENIESELKFTSKFPKKKYKKVALNISISGNISEERIKKVMGEDVDIIKIESNIKDVNVIKGKKEKELYRKEIRSTLEKIKDKYGEDVKINVFPAMPISLAVETGRCWLQKIHPKLVIYDEKNGFTKALEIEYKGDEK